MSLWAYAHKTMTEPYYPQEWQNYGDVNPERHGGLFVKWEHGMWHCIETRHFADLPDGISEDEHMFTHVWVEPQDIWIDGDPYEGFTDDALKFFSEYSRQPFNISNNPDLPEGETYESYVDYYMQDEIEWIVSTYIHSHVGYYGGNDTDFSPDYWNYLENQGIDTARF